jgi:hypothetical protein
MAMFIPFGTTGLFDEFMQTLDVAVFETPLRRVGQIIKWSLFEPEMMSCVVQEARTCHALPPFPSPRWGEGGPMVS